MTDGTDGLWQILCCEASSRAQPIRKLNDPRDEDLEMQTSSSLPCHHTSIFRLCNSFSSPSVPTSTFTSINMPRQRRSAAPAGRRPTVAPARPNVTPPQQGPNRSATTLARPVGPNGVQGQGPATQTQQPGQKQPGLFGQMVSTAAYVAFLSESYVLATFCTAVSSTQPLSIADSSYTS